MVFSYPMTARTRQDELIRLLRRSGSTSVAYITESLDASRRTVLRDIAELRKQGFVIHTSSGPGGGVYLEPTSVLVSPKLSSTEVFALLISIAVIKEAHSLPFAHLADAGLNKIEQSLPKDRVKELREILACVYIGRPTVEIPLSTVNEIDSTVLPSFETSFLYSRRMRFRYTDRDGNRTNRQADPHAMLVLSPCWYLIGYDPDKDAFRHFRMDRITKAESQDETFERQAFSVQEGECPFTRFRSSGN